MISRKALLIFALFVGASFAADAEENAATGGKSEARVLVGKHVSCVSYLSF